MVYHAQLVPVPPGLAHRVRGSAITLDVCCLPLKTLQNRVYKNILNYYRAQKAVKIFIKKMRKDGIAVSVEEPGLSLSKDKQYLGASLDRVVTMIGTGKKWGVEIKSPFSKADMTVEGACKAKSIIWRNWLMGVCNLKETTATSVKFKASYTVPLYCSKESFL